MRRGLPYVPLHRQILAVALGTPSSENKFRGGRKGKRAVWAVKTRRERVPGRQQKKHPSYKT